MASNKTLDQRIEDIRSALRVVQSVVFDIGLGKDIRNTDVAYAMRCLNEVCIDLSMFVRNDDAES